MDSITFSDFSGTGVSTDDTFDIWRLKTNGIAQQVQTISENVASLYTGSDINYLTVNTAQTVSAPKTFLAGNSLAPILKVGTSGLYFNDGILKITSPIQSDTVIAAATLKLGGNAYSVPSGAGPSATAYLTGSSGALSWKDENSLITSIAARVSTGTWGILNQIVPIGTISAYSGAVTPTGWLICNGSVISSVTYPDLFAQLGTTYGVAGTLPNLQGRTIVGVGTGNDGINSQSFTLGQYSGSYNHSLSILEIPSHTHGAGTLATASDGAHTHPLDNVLRYPSIGGVLAEQNQTGSPQDYSSVILSTGSAGAHTHSITGATASAGSNTPTPFGILQPYLSTIYIIKALPDVVVNTVLTPGNGIQFNSSSLSFNIKDSGTYTVSINHNSTLTTSGGVLSVAAITGSEISVGTITSDKLAIQNGGSISWDGSHAYYNGSPLLTEFTANLTGSVKQFREKTHGNTSPLSWQEYAYINHDNNVVVTGATRYSIFGACNAFGHQIMPLPLNRQASKLYISEYSMACIDTTGQLWAIGRNSYNQFNLVSGSTVDLVTWTQAFPQITNVITKVVLGTYNTYVLEDSHNLWSAGNNTYGQLGNGTNVNTSDCIGGHQTVACNSTVSDVIICGSELTITSCILSTNNNLYTCGYGASGQIGNSSTVNKNDWTLVSKPSGIANWSGYVLYSKGSLTDGGFFVKNATGSLLYAWGYNGDNTFGITTTPAVTIPYKVWDDNVNKISKFYPTYATGVTYILAVNKIYATGNNSSGNFGNNLTTSNGSWQDITPSLYGYSLLDLYVSNSASSYCSVIIKCSKGTDKFLFGAGSNFNGQLGNAGVTTSNTSWTPILINSSIVSNIYDVQLGYNTDSSSYSLLLLNDGELYWAGYNKFNFDSGMEPSFNNSQYRTIFNRVK